MKKPADSFFTTILAINTGAREAVQLALVKQGVIIASEEFPVRSQELQARVVDFLADNHTPLSELKALAVFRTGESLTGSRMGIASVNTLAWLNNIPIIEINEPDFNSGLQQLTEPQLNLSVVKQTLPMR